MTKTKLHRRGIIALCCLPGVGSTVFVILAIANQGRVDWLLRNCSLLAIPMLTVIAGLVLLQRRQHQHPKGAMKVRLMSAEGHLSESDQ